MSDFSRLRNPPENIMCIGIPMQVTRIEPGHAICQGRGETRCVRTALVGDIQAGDWVLIFLDRAQDLLAACLQESTPNGPMRDDTVAFDLPSRMSREELLAISSGTTPHQ